MSWFSFFDPAKPVRLPVALGLSLLSSLSLVLLTLKTPPTLYSDQAAQLAAVQLYLQGQTPFPNIFLEPIPENLTKDRADWIAWWAPGFPVLVTLICKLGFSLGTSVKILVDTLFVLGSVGWAACVCLFRLPAWATYTLAFTLPWMRYANNNLLQISGEIMTWGSVPFALLGAVYILNLWQYPKARPQALLYFQHVFFGCLLALLYYFKYSAFLINCGILFYFGLCLLSRFSWQRFWLLGVILIGVVLPVYGLNLINYALKHQANLVTASWHPHFNLQGAFYVFLELPLALGDGGQIYDWIFLHAFARMAGGELLSILPGLPGVILLGILFWRHRAENEIEQLALTVWCLTGLLLLILITVTTGVGYDRRFIAASSLAALPLILRWILSDWQKEGTSRVYRISLVAFCIFYLVIPLIYGLITIPLKMARCTHYQTASSGIYNPFLAQSNLAGVIAQLDQAIPPQGAYLWYSPDPLTYFDLKGRRLFVYVDFCTPESLARAKYVTSSPLHLLMVMPESFETSGKAELVRKSFPQAGPWVEKTLPESECNLWITDLTPATH